MHTAWSRLLFYDPEVLVHDQVHSFFLHRFRHVVACTESTLESVLLPCFPSELHAKLLSGNCCYRKNHQHVQRGYRYFFYPAPVAKESEVFFGLLSVRHTIPASQFGERIPPLSAPFLKDTVLSIPVPAIPMGQLFFRYTSHGMKLVLAQFRFRVGIAVRLQVFFGNFFIFSQTLRLLNRINFVSIPPISSRRLI